MAVAGVISCVAMRAVARAVGTLVRVGRLCAKYTESVGGLLHNVAAEAIGQSGRVEIH